MTDVTSLNPESPTQPKISTSKKKILVVEDEKQYREVLSERLLQEGYDVLQAENGQTALNILKNTDAHLILLDMLMPQMDGVTFFYHLKNTLKKEIPVIIRNVPVNNRQPIVF